MLGRVSHPSSRRDFPLVSCSVSVDKKIIPHSYKRTIKADNHRRLKVKARTSETPTSLLCVRQYFLGEFQSSE